VVRCQLVVQLTHLRHVQNYSNQSYNKKVIVMSMSLGRQTAIRKTRQLRSRTSDVSCKICVCVWACALYLLVVLSCVSEQLQLGEAEHTRHRLLTQITPAPSTSQHQDPHYDTYSYEDKGQRGRLEYPSPATASATRHCASIRLVHDLPCHVKQRHLGSFLQPDGAPVPLIDQYPL
jgi:hypothetical protein